VWAFGAVLFASYRFMIRKRKAPPKHKDNDELEL
jgi:hypothetical protein